MREEYALKIQTYQSYTSDPVLQLQKSAMFPVFQQLHQSSILGHTPVVGILQSHQCSQILLQSLPLASLLVSKCTNSQASSFTSLCYKKGTTGPFVYTSSRNNTVY